MDSVLRLSRHKMELQNIELATQLQPGVILIRGNNNRLQQTLLNLIFNAIEAMPDGGRLQITSKADLSKKQVKIEIHDTGSGIPEKYLSHIFDPFFTTKFDAGGVGLGLSIAAMIVEEHGGELLFVSEPGKGTSIEITLPLTEV